MDKVQDIPVQKVSHKIQYWPSILMNHFLKAIKHPDYDPNLYNNVINDIALIMLSQPANIAGKGF